MYFWTIFDAVRMTFILKTLSDTYGVEGEYQ